MRRLVLIDLDDTLMDHIYASSVTLTHVYNTFSEFHTRTCAEVTAHHDDLLEELHIEVARGNMPLQAAREERYTRMLVAAGVKPYAAKLKAVEVAREARAKYLKSRILVPGAKELLEALAGKVTVGIVTNNTVDEQKEKLHTFGLSSLIDFLLVSEEIGITKPDPRIFHEALKRGGASADQTVMLGDSWFSDIRGALAAGIRPVWFNRTGKPRPEQADVHEITSLQPLEIVLRAIGINGGRVL
jgi:putative hydrolase of the HAD superfamily